MVIGFTGTRGGMTGPQKEVVKQLLVQIIEKHGSGVVVVLHGDCIGVDAEFDTIATELGLERTCRPCTFDHMRANTTATEVSEPDRPMARNRAIVAEADIIIGCPQNDKPIKTGSGTWATIRFTKKADKPLHIVYPDGRAVSSSFPVED